MLSVKDFFDIDKVNKKEATDFRPVYAVVEALDAAGRPLLRFHGETNVSQKVYPRLSSYAEPRIGDRVVLIGGIIYGSRF